MISDERIRTFINSLDDTNTPFLDKVEAEALAGEVPIVRKDMQGFLKFILRVRNPKSVLEIGTATGFSALLMATYSPDDCHITTIEKYEKRIPVAKRNFRESGLDSKLTLLEGDASEFLKSLEGEYDLIFLDAAKAQYGSYLPDLLRLLPEGGMLITDNVLQDGDVLESRYAVTRRNRTIHTRMREFLYSIKHHPMLHSVILTIGDGVAVSVKKEKDDEKA